MKLKWLFLVLILLAAFSIFKFTGLVFEDTMPPEQVGAPQDEIDCMFACVSVGCADGNKVCMVANSEDCLVQCNAGQPEPADESEACMQECVVVGCEDYDFDCQEVNRAQCDIDCGMIKEPKAQSEEEQCIRDCVAKVDPSLICSSGSVLGEGEQGNDVCQRCSEECVSLYSGPCLDDEGITSKENECKTCEHCYGEPVMGDSGQGYECIVDIKCMDSSSEFGDEPGSGPGIVEESSEVGIVGSIVGFFKGLFSF